MRRSELAEHAVSAGSIVVPWVAIAWSPATLLASVCSALVVAGAAAHGFGSALASVLERGEPRQRKCAIDAMCLGAAAILVVGGWLTAVHLLDHRAQLGLVIAGLLLHTFTVVRYRREADLVARCRAALTRSDLATAMLWIVVLALLGLHVAGLLSSQHAAPYDDDGNWFAAVKRLRDTGGVHDAIGYARAYQLGGNVVSSVFAATVADVHCTRVAEALGFVLTVLGLARIALSSLDRHRAAAMIFLLLALALSSKAQAEFDATLFWLPAALFVAVFRHLLTTSNERGAGDAARLIVLLAALCAIRLEYVPFALAVVARSADAPRWRARVRQMLVPIGSIALGLAPMVFEWCTSRDANGARAIVRFAPFVTALAITACIALVPRRGTTAFGTFAFSIAVTATVSLVHTPAGAFTGRVLWVPIFAMLYVALAALARAQWAARDTVAELRYATGTRARFRFATAAILVASTLAFVMRAQDTTVRMSWRLRFLTWLQDTGELALTPATPIEPDRYGPLLRQVPHDATVLLSISAPERIDYHAHRALDLRVPRRRDLRELSWTAHSAALTRLIRATGARYLLVELDLERRQRARESVVLAFWCRPTNALADPVLGMPASCADPLEEALVDHRVVASLDGVVLIDLTAVH